MIQPIPREEVFRKLPNLAAEISRIQKEMFDADELDFMESEDAKISYLQAYDAL